MLVRPLPGLRVVEHRFTPDDLCSGHLVLDFVNTAAGLNRDPRDWLDSYHRLLEWADLTGAFDAGLLHGLARKNHDDPRDGADALTRARHLRSSLYALVHNRRIGSAPPMSDLTTLEEQCRQAGALLSLATDGSGLVRPSLERLGLHLIAATVSQAAVGLLSDPAIRIGVCGGHNCGWVFMRSARAPSRRWCDMKTCGNAAKANRHYHRTRTARCT